MEKFYNIKISNRLSKFYPIHEIRKTRRNRKQRVRVERDCLRGAE
jgi:hypothetical protein